MNVVLKHAGRWLHFSRPETVLKADSPAEVLPLLKQAEESGLYAAGFISYEAAPAFDTALKTHAAEGFPLLCIGLFQPPDVLETLESNPSASFEMGELKPSVSKQEFVSAIGEIKEQIAAGATYQVNFTYRLNADFEGDSWAFFCDLVKGQKTDHAAYIELDDYAICSASPELFFSYNNGRIVSRPMKGTARRGRTFAEDFKQAEALRNSEKDRAENIMIVDMIRNDIGRVSEPGSVETVSTYDVEKYPTVWQMTSTVQGRMKPPINTDERGSVSGILTALFPCASITGAPKAKTMEIIHGLETAPRKIYTGSIGFMTPQGEACFNVAIRTALIDRLKDSLEFGIGGGIVWDSDAESEYEETLTKARVLTQFRPDFKLLETMRWEPEAGIFLLDEHLQRLGKSAAYFDVPLEVYEVHNELEQVFQTLEHIPHRIRLLISREGTIEVEAVTLKKDMGIMPMKVALAKTPVDSQDVFLFHKTTHRAVYEKAKAEFPKCDDVILWNEKGEVTESCISNVVIRKNGRLMTPPVTCGLLDGTYRQYLLKTGEIEEERITLDDLKTADEVLLVNSVRKWQKTLWSEREIWT